MLPEDSLPFPLLRRIEFNTIKFSASVTYFYRFML